jgi:hypothetical protein
LADGTMAIGTNHGNNLGSINISSSEINKLKAEFTKKYSNLYTTEEAKPSGEEWSLISSIWYKNHLICPPRGLFQEIVLIKT